MKIPTDHDGKSKTASAVHHHSYPEQHEVDNSEFEEIDSLPSHDQVAQRAFEIWLAKGCPEGSAIQDWLDAEEELRAAINSHDALAGTARRAGSVQP